MSTVMAETIFNKPAVYIESGHWPIKYNAREVITEAVVTTHSCTTKAVDYGSKI